MRDVNEQKVRTLNKIVCDNVLHLVPPYLVVGPPSFPFCKPRGGYSCWGYFRQSNLSGFATTTHNWIA